MSEDRWPAGIEPGDYVIVHDDHITDPEALRPFFGDLVDVALASPLKLQPNQEGQ